jgi:hypothetical protein
VAMVEPQSSRKNFGTPKTKRRKFAALRKCGQFVLCYFDCLIHDIFIVLHDEDVADGVLHPAAS